MLAREKQEKQTFQSTPTSKPALLAGALFVIEPNDPRVP